MNDLAAVLGRKAVLSLATLAGGRQLRIPSMSDDPTSTAARARLVKLVGLALAEDLLTHFARSRVYVPRGPSAHNSRSKPIDARKVDRLTKRGLAASIIAERLGCTERTVYKKRAQLAQRRKDRP